MNQSLQKIIFSCVLLMVPYGIIYAARDPKVIQYSSELSIVNGNLPAVSGAGQQGKAGYILSKIFETTGPNAGTILPDYIPNSAQTTAVNLGPSLIGTPNYIVKYTGTGITISNSIIQDNGSSVSIGASINPSYRINVGGIGAFDSILSRGIITQSSDARLKENVQTLVNPLDKIMQLRAVHFTWKESKKGQLGFIAQEVEKIYPENVIEDGRGYKSVDYIGLLSPVVGAIQELNQSLVSLFAKYIDQEKRIEALEKRLDLLEKTK